MKNSRYIKLLVFVLFLIFIIWKYFSLTKEHDNLFNDLNREYAWLSTDDSIDNVIIKTYYPSEWRGAAYFQYITLDDGRMFSINIDRGITSRDIYYGNIAKQGTRIIKKAGSDTLIVFKNEKEILFLIKQSDDEMNVK